jgi:hypothetical protein
VRALVIVAASLAAAGCGKRSSGGAADDAAAPVAEPSPPPIDAAPPVDAAVAIDELDALPPGAVPAWRAVVDRARYLVRRSDRGVLFGTAGAAVDGSSQLRWLVDDTTGGGSLGVRTDLSIRRVAEGSRVAVWGGWKVDDQHRWYWAADRAARVPADGVQERRDGFWYPSPSHQVARAGELPDGAIVVEEADPAGGAIFFQVIRRPVRDGDGWVVAGRSHWPAAAVLVLPGERESYGGQDMKSDDERWHLDKKTSYALVVRRWRKPRKEGELPRLRAVTAPIRIEK